MLRYTSFLPITCFLFLLGCDSGNGSPGTTSDIETPLSLAELDRRILAEPSNAVLYVQRAKFHEAHDSIRAAIGDWNRAILLDSTSAVWRIGLGDLYYRKVDLPKAEAQFTKAVALAPDSTEARFKLAEIRLVQGEYEAAMQLTNEALKLDDQNARGYFLKGWIHGEAGDTTLAISSYRTAVERDRDLYEAYIALGLIHAARKDPLAMQYYNSAVELRPNSVEAWYDKGMFAQDSGQDSIALACYARIKEIDPKNATAWYNTGFVLMEHLDRVADARKEFARAIAVLPTYSQAYFNRGLTYELEGSLDSALLDYKRALALRPDLTEAAEGLDRLQIKGVKVR